jgi:DNA invertase Pin-like site-specific DNA recombinase
MARIKYKEAAGIKAKKGKPSMGKKPEKSELKKLYIKESRSIREAAEILGCTKDMVYRALQEYGIERRLRTSNKKLADYSMENLVADVQKEGIRGLARELGVTEGAIRYHLRKLD